MCAHSPKMMICGYPYHFGQNPIQAGLIPTPQFVHHFGKAVERCSEPDLAWPDENKFCLAKRALRLFDLASYEAGATGAIFRPKCAFRRLFFDGESVGASGPIIAEIKKSEVI